MPPDIPGPAPSVEAVGAGSFSLPYAFIQAGPVAGIILLLGFGALGAYTMALLADAEKAVVKRNQESFLGPTRLEEGLIASADSKLSPSSPQAQLRRLRSLDRLWAGSAFSAASADAASAMATATARSTTRCYPAEHILRLICA